MNHQQLIDERIIDCGGKHGGATHAIKIAQGLEIHVSQDEFEKRARELGYVNGYRYGVEYPTNGKKPDLPDDVVVCFKEIEGAWDVNGGREVWKWNWVGASGFKITDARYKPADTSYLDKPAEQKPSAVPDAVSEFRKLPKRLQELLKDSFEDALKSIGAEEKPKPSATAWWMLLR